MFWSFEFWKFEFVSDFDIRISNLQTLQICEPMAVILLTTLDYLEKSVL